jgi:hypothetical protein
MLPHWTLEHWFLAAHAGIVDAESLARSLELLFLDDRLECVA